jgi:hypothetical protein
MEKESENAEKFHCELCDFECCKKSNYDKHILTQKHKNRTFSNNLEQKNAGKCQTFSCKNCNHIMREIVFGITKRNVIQIMKPIHPIII